MDERYFDVDLRKRPLWEKVRRGPTIAKTRPETVNFENSTQTARVLSSRDWESFFANGILFRVYTAFF